MEFDAAGCQCSNHIYARPEWDAAGEDQLKRGLATISSEATRRDKNPSAYPPRQQALFPAEAVTVSAISIYPAMAARICLTCHLDRFLRSALAHQRSQARVRGGDSEALFQETHRTRAP